ncbi:hypothetical protein MRX96_037843 [Rhipicephalus microplus]
MPRPGLGETREKAAALRRSRLPGVFFHGTERVSWGLGFSRATSLLVWLGLYSAAGDENYGRQHLGQEPGAASVERVSRSNLQGAEQEARIQLDSANSRSIQLAAARRERKVGHRNSCLPCLCVASVTLPEPSDECGEAMPSCHDERANQVRVARAADVRRLPRRCRHASIIAPYYSPPRGAACSAAWLAYSVSFIINNIIFHLWEQLASENNVPHFERPFDTLSILWCN